MTDTSTSKQTSTTMHHHYDLIVIGAGSGGLGAAGIARALGLKTLLVEAKAQNVGGDCLNYGCVPSKALIHVSRLAAAAKEAQAFGMAVGGEMDFALALDHVHAAQARIREHENAEYFDAMEHQDMLIGWAKFVSHNTIEVEGQHYSARRIVLATGSRPVQLQVPGIDKVKALYTNHNFFTERRELPRQLLIVGGGPIACELGQAMARLGSKVTMINKGDRLLSKELPAFSKLLQKRLEDEGVRIFHRSEVLSFADAHTAMISVGGRDSLPISFNEVLQAIGRDSSVRGMDLDKAGIAVDEKGSIKVDHYYQSSNPDVYVVGDAFGQELFSHGAEMHNRDLIRNILMPFGKTRHDLEHFSWVTFCDPEIATFGLNAEQLSERNIEFDTWEQSFKDDDRAIASGYADESMLVLYVSKGSLFGGRRILGGSMIAPGAGEMIQELILAMQEGLSTQAIFNKIYPYPTASRINQKAVFEHRKPTPERLLKPIRWWWRR